MTDRAPSQPGSAPPPGVADETPATFLDRLEAQARAGLRTLPPADAAALDALAAALARGAGAQDLALGEGLLALSRGGDVRLGYSGIGDLARERLGIAADRARRLRRMADRLRSRPLLREAVVSGDVTLRKAEVVVRVAVGADEAYWVARAKADTVRRLEGAVRGGDEHAEADWHRLRIALPPGEAQIVETAVEIAAVVVGPAAPLWRRIGAIAMEFLGFHPIDPRERIARAPAAPRSEAAGDPPPDVARFPACGAAPPVVPDAPGPRAPAEDPYDILDRLVRLVRGRAGEDELLGRACLLVRRFGVWRRDFPGFDWWCAERLGLAPSTVRQRVALERRLERLPPLREALRSGRLSYEQARLVSRVASPSDVEARIAAAAATTCIGYRRELDGEAHRQMWRAGELRAVVPDDVDDLLADALRSARACAPGLRPGEALVLVSLHFIRAWKEHFVRAVRAANPAILRDAGLCQIPGCSRAADHVHHLWFRAQGGPLELWNELSLCEIHHLLCVHGGTVRIEGTAPGDLTFTLGAREVAAARWGSPAANRRGEA